MIVFTEISAFFAAPYLAEALGAELYVMNTQYNDFFGKNTVMGKSCGIGTVNIKSDTDITIIGYTALKAISHRIIANDFNRINFIVSDSPSCVNYMWWNEFVPKHNIQLYIMPDIKDYCFIDYKPIYQILQIDKSLIKEKQTERLLITHSPRSKGKQDVKGTSLIVDTITKLKKRYDFDFKLITGVSMNQSVIEKSKSHVFIDQIVYKNSNINQKRFGNEIKYNGGLGKSGIESMMCNCATIVGAPNPNTEPHFNTPPITWTDVDKFELELERLISDESIRNQQIINQNHWLDTYNYEFIKTYLT